MAKTPEWMWHAEKFDEAHKRFKSELKSKKRGHCFGALGALKAMARQAALFEDKTLMGRSRKATSIRARHREALGRASTRFGSCMRRDA